MNLESMKYFILFTQERGELLTPAGSLAAWTVKEACLVEAPVLRWRWRLRRLNRDKFLDAGSWD